jgi:hypothetical protein
MTKKATKPDLAALKLKATNDAEMNIAVNLARNVATNPNVHAGSAMQPWLKHVYADVALNELIAKLGTQTDAMKGGDMSDIEAMLFNQALTLQTMFTALSRRAANNVGKYTNTVDLYMKLAFKAQAQCRSTLEALAEMKQPRSATFVRQANIANGPQQVNNGNVANMQQYAPAPARDTFGNQPNELITDERATNGNPMDTRSAATASAGNSNVEAVEAR